MIKADDLKPLTAGGGGREGKVPGGDGEAVARGRGGIR